MEGNLIPDSSGNIFVEFDYNNLIVVDPNKTIKNEKVSERLVDHENLVMYANLEADVLPRTKLAVGISPENSGLETVSVAKMNFLKPTKNSYLGTGYLDELTGKNVTKFDGTNQPKEVYQTSKNGSKPYISNTVVNESNIVDNGLLGITQINVVTNSSFVPTVTMELEDVQGRALFQLGGNSPYSAFFNLPYPPFYLTLKGYYGQAIRYQLNLEKFNARFNSVSGNYQVSLTFKGYKFNILNEIAMGHLIATPHMYSQRFSLTQNPEGLQQTNKSAESQSKTQNITSFTNPKSPDAVVSQIVAERGYQKIIEVYSEYKSKGLIPKDFPELTVVQLMTKLETFETLIAASFDKTEVEALTNIRNYKSVLTQYFANVRGATNSWFNTYLNPNPVFLKNDSRMLYTFLKNDVNVNKQAVELLKENIRKYNLALSENPTLGSAGVSPIPNPINFEMLTVTTSTDNIDWVKSASQQTSGKSAAQSIIDAFTKQVTDLLSPIFIVKETNGEKKIEREKTQLFVFEGDGNFDKTIASLEAQANKKLSEYETKITADLLRKIEDKDAGIGFKPTVRSIVAVIMASAEAFIRLLDETHTKAWNVKYDPVRKRAILENTSSAPSTETIDNVVYAKGSLIGNTPAENAQIPVYPWPQFFQETPDDKKGRFQLKYIGDPSVVDLTGGADYSKWPEVEFVEEYMKGLTQKFQVPNAPQPLDNEKDTNIININAIEFPSTGIAYYNKEEIKFFYEIWERQFLTSHYSGYIRANFNQFDELIKLNVEAEVSNIKNGLALSSPYITFKLKNYGLNSNTYPDFLKNISNMGTGRAYQDYIRDFFVTPYIRSITENSYSILSVNDIGKIPQLATKSDALRKLINNASNTPLIVDTLPFTDSSWCFNNLNKGLSSANFEVYDTQKSLTIFESRKIIANFNDIKNFKFNRPVTSFSYLTSQNPTEIAASLGSDKGSIPKLQEFYNTRIVKNYIATEGYVSNVTPTGYLSPSTTSLMNTPYFINAIQNGIDNYKAKESYPYTQAGYLFINSLPLATLREKYKSFSDDGVTSELNYISSCFKKFGAVHKIPYAWIIKYGSIWYRYKKYKQNGFDMLESAWKNFNFSKNFNPITSAVTTQYSFKYNGSDENVILQSETPTDVSMQVGFYPKLVSDLNYFYNGYDLYSGYTNTEIQESVNNGMKLFNFLSSNINGTTNNNKQLRLKTWSVVLPNRVPGYDETCNPKNNTKGESYYIVPSFGTSFNQTVGACFTGNTTNLDSIVNITDNTSVYNGTVRSLWSAPNFGYFDDRQVIYPKPDCYLTRISTVGLQSPIEFLSDDSYTKIEEIFSVFEKRILDSFEQEFLNWCKPDTDINLGFESVTFNQNPVNLNSTYRNFQSFFKSLMLVPVKKDSETEETYFNNLIVEQYKAFQNNVAAFLQYDVIFRYGNPSNYNRRIFDSYLSVNGQLNVVDPIEFNPYVKNSLPSKGGQTTLTQSKNNNPVAWFELETQVGFSTIGNVKYSSEGSYITDFFIDNNIEFTAQNVILLAPLIKMYATQKLKSPTTTPAQFRNQIQQYLNLESQLQNNFLNGILSTLNATLPNQQQLPEKTIQSAISGDQSKVENYEIFKALNDKWIAGGDYTTKTLFEDILFLDRASRNIGDTLLIDIFDLKYMFGIGSKQGDYSLNQAMSVYTFISGLLIKNNFNVMNLPAYVNFYNVQDVDGIAQPQNGEGSLKFADSLWGTFLDVDYRKASPKMVCFYAGKPSQYLELPKGNFKFRDDAFDMRRASENPLIENLKGKQDWGVSNKCVGFNVDIGIRNQNIFYSFSVSQENGVATSESINTQLNMIDQASGKQTATQNVGLYNLYKNRSYKCTVTSLGNALIQPTMYFNLRHVPMFNGPYMIMDVTHSIQPGNFQTTFTGVRQGIFDLPAIDKFLQSINQNLLTRLEEILKINKTSVTVEGTTNQIKTTEVPQKANNTEDTPNACVANLNSSFAVGYQSVKSTLTQIKQKEFADALNKEIPNSPELRIIIYCLSYIKTFQTNTFYTWNNNLGLISLKVDWSGMNNLLSKNYSCVKVITNPSTSSSEPIAHFETIESYIRFMIQRLQQRVPEILRIGLAKWYVCHWPVDGVTEDYYDNHAKDFEQTTKTLFAAVDSAVKSGLSTIENSKDLKLTITVNEKKPNTPTITPSPSPVKSTNAVVANVCLPPKFTTISPIAGYTGTIIQLTGSSLSTTKEIRIANVLVPTKDVTIVNDKIVRFIVPKIFTGEVRLNTQVAITTDYGSFTGLTIFDYNPALKGTSTTSPGSIVNPIAANTPSVPGVTIPANTNITPGTNINPLSTGPITLLSKYETNSPPEITNTLTVIVNPSVGLWNIQSVVKMAISVYETKTINNVPTQKLKTNVEYPLSSYVVNNIFTITRENVKTLLFDTPIPPFDKTPINPGEVVLIQFVITAFALDKVKYPQPVTQSFNFVYNKPILSAPLSPASIAASILANQPGSIVKVAESNSGGLPDFNGPSYYNIKKPAGGYITFQFVCPNLLSVKSPTIVAIPSLDSATITINNNPGTKYTNVIDVNNLGTFQMVIYYTSSDLKWTSPFTNLIEPLQGNVSSPPFTL